jgi:3-dehydroquinate dehydratase-1
MTQINRLWLARICGSIGGKGVGSLRAHIRKAFSLGADYIEIRFDSLNTSDIEHAMRIAESSKDRAIFTLRSVQEGGKFDGTENERIEILEKLCIARPMLLDVEYRTIKNNDYLADFLASHQTPVLVSWHDFKRTPPTDRLRDILGGMKIYSNYAKIVTTAREINDGLRVLDLYEGATGLELIAFAMGEFGVISRILCTIVGNAPFAYASVNNNTGPGQLDLGSMRKLFDRINSNYYSKPNARRR